MGQGYPTATRQQYHFPGDDAGFVEEVAKLHLESDAEADPERTASMKKTGSMRSGGMSGRGRTSVTDLEKIRSMRLTPGEASGRKASAFASSGVGGSSFVQPPNSSGADGEWMYNLDQLDSEHKHHKKKHAARAAAAGSMRNEA
jgi:hypothetical protein